MKNKKRRILQLGEIKKSLQMFKAANKRIREIGGFVNCDQIQISDKDLKQIADLFRLPIQKEGDSTHHQGEISIEDVKIFSYRYDFDYNKDSSKYNRYTKTKYMYKEAFFVANGDREEAFNSMKKNDKHSYLKHYKTLGELEKFWSRYENSKTDTHQILSRYDLYRKNWNEWDEDEIDWKGDRINRKMGDYRHPATLKTWCQHNL